MWVGILVFMTMLGSLGAISIKKIHSDSQELIAYFFNKWLYIGGGLYLTCAVLNIYLLSIIDYSIVLPLTSFTYVWTIVFSKIFFNEKVNLSKVFAILLIISGVTIIAVFK